MTEHAEELYDDEFEEDELEDDTDDVAYDHHDRVAAVSQAVTEWEREAGIELSDRDFDHVARQVDLYGVSPDVAYERTDPGRFEADFQATVAAVQRDAGRTLAQSELDRMWDTAVQAAEDPTVESDAGVWTTAKAAIRNLDDSDQIAEHISEMLSVPQEREEPSATVVDDDGEETGSSFNYDNPSEREAAIDAAMSGETVSVHDSTDLESE